jgi:predicted AlkP superfamily phosphohydrolase/phosphomutase
MTQTVVFRMRPDSSRPIEDFKKAMESIKCDDKSLFHIKSYANKLMVRINEFFGENRNFKVELPNGKKLNLDEIIDFNPGHTGDHSENYGVFIIQGSKIKKGKKIGDITPYDITPTILSLIGEPISSEMDGRVLTEIFNI